MTTKVFPRSLRRAGEGEGLPSIRFSIKKSLPEAESEFQSVQLYMPSGLQFTDGANYNGVNLGVINAASKFTNTKAEDIKSTNDKFFSDSEGVVTGLKILDKIGVDQNLLAAQALQQGVAFNPATALAFENVNLRQFSFAFTLVPESEKESSDIRDIENFFRKYMYPEVEGFVSKYPPTFEIKFYDPIADDEIEESIYMPMIHDCYITGVDVTINPEGNSFHKASNGFAPTSTNMALTFAEGRMLSRHDIYNKDNLQYNYSRPNSSAEISVAPKGD
jgi:hypothetical protein